MKKGDALTSYTRRFREILGYDAHGNITAITRRGRNTATSWGVTDNLTLSYDGNRLAGVTETVADYDFAGSFEYKRASGSQYIYDANGSLVADRSRGIAYISYDTYGNLARICFTNGSVTEYVYSANGRKLSVEYRVAAPNTSVTFGVEPDALALSQTVYSGSTDYLLGGSLVVRDGMIDKCLFDGGYVKASAVNPTTYNFSFHYYNCDHLGNNREVVDSAGVVEQVTNYYPFGTPFTQSAAVMGASLQPYKYNGKELDRMHGLDTYDYGARQYNPVLGRWDRMDPLCEKYYSVSPYAYCIDNPVKFIDPVGREVRDGLGSYNEDNKDLKQLVSYLAYHDDPNSIMIVAHGVVKEGEKIASSINIQTYDPKTKEWRDNYISNGKDFSKFLSQHSKVWQKYKNGEIETKDLHVVFYSCCSSGVVQKISSDSDFEGITFIAPNRDLGVDRQSQVIVADMIETPDGKTVIDLSNKKGFGNWITYINGRNPYFNSLYPGDRNLKPGTAGFKYKHTFF